MRSTQLILISSILLSASQLIGQDRDRIIPRFCSQEISSPNFVREPFFRVCIGENEINAFDKYIIFIRPDNAVIATAYVQNQSYKKEILIYQAGMVMSDPDEPKVSYQLSLVLDFDDTSVKSLSANITLERGEDSHSIPIKLNQFDEFINPCAEVYDEKSAASCFKYWIITKDEHERLYSLSFKFAVSGKKQAFDDIKKITDAIIRSGKVEKYQRMEPNIDQVISKPGNVIIWDLNPDSPVNGYYYIPFGNNVTPQTLFLLSTYDIGKFFPDYDPQRDKMTILLHIDAIEHWAVDTKRF